VRVTDRGRPKAMLGPLPGRAQIENGIAEGWITPPAQAGRGLGPSKPLQARRRILDVLAEDRGD
jgi:antitoxin (DNA-binding transcriptional repressor) of toxin-antitoxin stability system